MRGFIGLKGIILLVSLFAIMGSSAIGLTSNSVLCVTHGKCDSLIKTVAGTLLSSDQKIGDATEILANETIMSQPEINGVPIHTMKTFLFWQIVFGFFTMFFYFYAIYWFATRFVVRSVNIESSAYIWVFISTVVILALFQILYEIYFEGGVSRIPFTGVITFLRHPTVLMALSNEAGGIQNMSITS